MARWHRGPLSPAAVLANELGRIAWLVPANWGDGLNGREQCSPTGLRVNLDIEPASQHSYNLLGQATPLLFGPFTQ
jgi:hypothetical protein